MAKSSKDTIYIDLDDEITSIIEKVQDSEGKVVALVLPKRSSVFQSIVNLKLLKRTAAEAKKHVVLITSEAGLLPMAGAVGLHVAKTLQSKPIIPDAPVILDRPVSVDDSGATTTAVTSSKVADQPVGGTSVSTVESNGEETIEVGDEGGEDSDTVSKKGAKKAEGSKHGGKRFKIPNFNKFRLRLFIGIALFVVLAVGWAYAYFVMPKATIIIKTNNVTVSSSITVTASPGVESLDLEKKIVPAKIEQFKSTESVKVKATGQKDVGTKATGKVSFALEDCSSQEVTIPAGTKISSSNLSFVTQADVLLKRVLIGDQCKNADFPEFSTATLNVIAEEAGDKYNLSPREYAVAGFPGVSATGQAMSGGTSQIITVVSQGDIDGARDKILSEVGDTGRQAVEGQLQAGGFISVPETLVRSEPVVTASPNVGDEAPEVSVTVAVTYTMTGAQREGVKQLLEADISSQIDPSTQNILNNGLDSALVKLTNKAGDGALTLSIRASALAGVQQDVDAIKASIAGKKKGEVQKTLSNTPGVEEVTVEFSPVWVYKTPSSTDKITVVFQQNDGSTTSGE